MLSASGSVEASINDRGKATLLDCFHDSAQRGSMVEVDADGNDADGLQGGFDKRSPHKVQLCSVDGQDHRRVHLFRGFHHPAEQHVADIECWNGKAVGVGDLQQIACSVTLCFSIIFDNSQQNKTKNSMASGAASKPAAF
jgi:hypothetical protein